MLPKEDDREPVEILAEEFLERHRNGEDVHVSEYEDRFPALAEKIGEVFPALLAMETARPNPVLAPQLESFDAVAKGHIRELGDFRIIRKIAQGGMGIVYEAEEVSLARRVAIKVLASNLISNKSALERFQREAKTVAKLHHTNIVSVFGAGEENGLHFFVMEYVDGKSLEQMITSGEFAGSFKEDWDWIAEVTKRIALALRHAHEKNILHRDVKSGNILIDKEKKPWITDFGLAKFEENEDLTRPGDAVGTLRYMSPEQLKGRPDRRSDVFGLGLVLYEMLVSGKAYGDTQSLNLFERISTRDLAPPSQFNERIPKDLEMITLKAIAIDPHDRYQNAIDFAEDLDRWQNDLPISARPLSTFESLGRWAKRNPLVAGLSAIVVCLFLISMIALGNMTLAWMGESQARRDAKLAQEIAVQAQQEAENRLVQAMLVLDQLTDDLEMFNQVGTEDPDSQSFLFSPMGALPVSRKTEKQLDLVQGFYQSVGKTTEIRDEIRLRIFLANIRSSEISLQLRKYDDAREELEIVLGKLKKDVDPKLLAIRLYAGELMGYANFQARDFNVAAENFEYQLKLIEEINLKDPKKRLERGKALLGLALVKHNLGNVQQWHDSILSAINEFESLVQWDQPTTHPVAAVFLARSYLNVPPRFRSPGYAEFYRRCMTRAVSILFELHQWQQENATGQNQNGSRLFLYDYCDAVASLPVSLETIQLYDNPEYSIHRLLTKTIQECQVVVQQNPDIPAFRFALARCQVNLALRLPNEFEQLSQAAAGHLKILVTSFPSDPLFLTSSGEVHYRIGTYFLAGKQFARAKPHFQRGLNDLDASMRSSIGFPKTQVLLPSVHRNLALVFDGMKDPKSASYHRSQEAAIRKAFPHPNAGPDGF